MLFQLNIKNLALIKVLNIEFEEELNVLTGETGAGKSIIIEAIDLILGGYAASDLIRDGEDSLMVEALFLLTPQEKELINNLNSDIEIVDGQGALLIRREVNKKGRNKCLINQRLINLSTLQEIGTFLVDLHGQHNHQSLLDPAKHIDLMDNLGGDKMIKHRKELYDNYRRWREKNKKLFQLLEDKEENLKKMDFLKFQLEEIDKTSLVKDEDKALEEEEMVLKNAEKIIETMEKANFILYEGGIEQSSVRDSLNEVSVDLGEIASLDRRIEKIRENLKEVGYQFEDIVNEIVKYKDGIDLDSQKLKEVEGRLNLINSLKSKYGSTIEEILTYRQKIYQELEAVDYSEDKLEKLKEEVNSLEDIISTISRHLNINRRKIAEDLQKMVVRELEDLNMKRCQFEVSINSYEDDNGIEIDGKKYKIGPKGIDDIEFMISPNVGERLRPLARIVSGGEVSRIMLALKSILSEVDQVPTLIFDEIDSGVGARLGEVIAQKLKALSGKRQVICVTHLPQIACKAERHFYIEKYILNNQTGIRLKKMEGEERVKEIARMLDGSQMSEIAIRHAQKMLDR
ncbi:DNA repair protein RecN [Candidatus Atribacteria bacterium RBG_19FT_COMBO_35_14]|uniref:DNA repair protein RecN n=1 Tax=Candidatus Sediminicultor quintus TaxID=1797291 RepID=A0A1F5A8B2_9BACT|nr:MAG: DNA repair protein RecN [Candidatus Atribacteria bacterium RBG_19FT_COMBO_35_14]